MRITTTISANEYRLVRILRALANENRFIVFKNLKNGRCYATELNDALKMSRPALGKHVRILINERLVEQKHVVENGTAKAVYELTDFGEKIADKLDAFKEDVEAITNQIVNEFREELMDVNTQINSTKAILKGLEERSKNKQISPKDYEALKSDYERKINELRKRRKELKNRLEDE